MATDTPNSTPQPAPIALVKAILVIRYWRMFEFVGDAARCLCGDACRHETAADAATCLVAQVNAARG